MRYRNNSVKPMRASFWLSCWIVALALDLHAAEIVPPGDYTTERAWGSMEVGPVDGHGKQKFRIESIGGNGHLCGLEGDIIGRKATSDADCRIEFRVRPGEVAVDVLPGSEQQCREHCGMRAWFDGSYYPKIPFCQMETAVRDDFLRLYQAGNFLKARDTLRDLLKRCGKFLTRYADAEVRNDLAITEFRLGNSAACLRTLEPLKAIFVDDPDKTGAAFALVDESWADEMLKTTRFNWRRCGGTPPPPSERAVKP